MSDMQKMIAMIRERLILEKNYAGSYAYIDPTKRKELKMPPADEPQDQTNEQPQGNS